MKKQVALVDSIFKNYYVPPIILGGFYEVPAYCGSENICIAVMSKEDGTEEKVCIDGKQRLTTINACVYLFACNLVIVFNVAV